MRTYGITLQQNPLFWLGDRFYKVEEPTFRYGRTDRTEFSSKCPSCNGTRRIAYKGYNGGDFECECPVCKGSIGRGYGDRIELSNWEIHEYIVYEIEARGPETLSAYKGGMGYVDSVNLTAFCKIGKCADDYITAVVPFVENNVDRDVKTIDISAHCFDSRDYVFRKRADAKIFLEMLKEHDRQRLAEFNKTYGTEYEYPFS